MAETDPQGALGKWIEKSSPFLIVTEGSLIPGQDGRTYCKGREMVTGLYFGCVDKVLGQFAVKREARLDCVGRARGRARCVGVPPALDRSPLYSNWRWQLRRPGQG